MIDPHSTTTRRLENALTIVSIAITVHLCCALARGGSWGCFIRLFKNLLWVWREFRRGNYLTRAGETAREFIASWQVRTFWWRGCRAFFGSLIWLVLPTLLLGIANRTRGLPVLLTVIGGWLLIPVLIRVPFLQAHFAVEDRWGSLFDRKTIRDLRRRAPICHLLAIITTYALSLPLYLLTIVVPPRDALWLVTVVFIAAIYPARICVGWAYYHAWVRTDPAFFLWRWSAWILTWGLLGTYVFLLFFTQFIGEHGKLVLFEHPSLLLPVPF
jgi:hypothetical protein